MSKLSRGLALAAIVLVAGRASAVVSVSTDFQVGPGGAGSTFTPTYAVSSTDLINGQAPTASAGNYAFELSGGLPVLNDGAYGTITEPGGAADRTHGAFGVAGGGSGTGTFVTYSLGTNPTGYNISSIVSYGGWNDNGRDQQAYTVAYSTVASPGTFIDIATVSFNPAVANNLQTANRVTIADDTLPNLATGAAAVRFTFNPATENGYSGYAELDVNGAPTPEPGAATLLFVSAGALLARRRL
jgi:hypothetical protein